MQDSNLVTLTSRTLTIGGQFFQLSNVVLVSPVSAKRRLTRTERRLAYVLGLLWLFVFTAPQAMGRPTGLIAVTLIGSAGLAWRYFSRAKHSYALVIEAAGNVKAALLMNDLRHTQHLADQIKTYMDSKETLTAFTTQVFGDFVSGDKVTQQGLQNQAALSGAGAGASRA